MAALAQVHTALCPSYDLPVVREALAELLVALGGLGQFIPAGGIVLVKPNLLSPRSPAEAVTTHPALVRAVVEACLSAGAAEVWLGDSCAGSHDDLKLWETTGMAEVAAATGARLKSFRGSVYGHACGEMQVPVPEWFQAVDCWISLPKLKTHTLTLMTCAVKNTYGLVAGNAKSLYHASHPSPRTMSRFLLDVYQSLKPSLVIVDSVVAMEGEGPANGTPLSVGLLLAGTDAVAVDTVCSRLLVRRPESIPTLRLAAQAGVGASDPERIEVLGGGRERLRAVRFKPSMGRFLQNIPEPIFHFVTRFLACCPEIDTAACVGCGICRNICSQGAIVREPGGRRYAVQAARCIMCMCCMESCPYHAITVRSPWRRFAGVRRFWDRLCGRHSGGSGRDEAK